MPPVVEIFPDGAWVDITDRHRAEAGLGIFRGRRAETGGTSSTCAFVLDNTGATFSSDRPGTPYYRTLGRGTPVRVTDTVIVETFTRTASNGWGVSEYPSLAWENAGGVNADYSVTAGVGRHTLSTTVSSRLSFVGLMMRDAILRAPVTIGALTTGATARAALVARRTPNGAAHYRFELRFLTTGVVDAAIVRLGGPGQADLDTATLSGTYTAGSTYELLAVASGEQLYFKAWVSGTTEPADWTCTAEDGYFRAGDFGVRTVRDTGNTNGNLTFDWGSYTLSEPRFFGEVWSMRPMTGQGGADLTMTVEASGLLRRLSNTDKALRSPMFRTVSTGGGGVTGPATAPAAYWPLEDGRLATQLEAIGDGVRPGQVSGAVRLASEGGLDGSDPLPNLGAGAFLSGTVPTFTGFDATATEWTWTFLCLIDEAPDEDSRIAWVSTYEGTSSYEIVMEAAGNITFRGAYPASIAVALYGFDFTTTVGFDSATSAAAQPTLFGQWVAFTVYSTIVSPGNYRVSCSWESAERLSATATLTSGTSATVRREPRGTWLAYGMLGTDTAFGHMAFWDVEANVDYRPATGWVAEQAGERFVRLCEEEGVSGSVMGGESEMMGPQLTASLADNFDDVSDADLGMLIEPRHELGLVYRTRTTLYNQVPVATLDLSADEVSDGLAPIRDDARGLANVITATRSGGTAQRFSIPDGDVFHLTTEDPPDGIGAVEASVSPNVYTDQHAAAQAGWHAHLRASREPRYEQIEVKLHAPAYTADPELRAAVTGLDIGDCIQLTNQPSWAPADPIELLVQGIEEANDGVERVVRINCTPAVPWEVWNIDTSGSTLVRAIDSDDTSLKFATSAGPEWITSPDPGFLVQIAGEAMGVTGLTTDTATYVGVGAASHGDNASLAPALPASVAVGDAMILVAAIRNTAASVTTPSGWTVLSSAYNAFRIYGRYNVSGDVAPTVAFSGGAVGDTTSAFVFAFRGLSLEDSDARFGQSTGSPENQSNASAQNIAYPAMSVRRDGSVVLYVAWKQDDFTSATGPGDAEIIEASTVTGNDQSLVAYYDIQPTAVDVTAGTITIVGGLSAISRVILLALRPTQTVTVTRSANGVVQSIAAGEDVHVWRHGAMPL